VELYTHAPSVLSYMDDFTFHIHIHHEARNACQNLYISIMITIVVMKVKTCSCESQDDHGLSFVLSLVAPQLVTEGQVWAAVPFHSLEMMFLVFRGL
jgi:hypothetical protein